MHLKASVIVKSFQADNIPVESRRNSPLFYNVRSVRYHLSISNSEGGNQHDATDR